MLTFFRDRGSTTQGLGVLLGIGIHWLRRWRETAAGLSGGVGCWGG